MVESGSGWDSGSAIRFRTVTVFVERTMPRRSIAILLVLALLPIPGKSQLFGASSCLASRCFGSSGSFLPLSKNFSEVPNLVAAVGNESPAGILWIALTESEISEAEGDEDGEVGRVDFACIFDRQIRSTGHRGNFESRSYCFSIRFSNPCELFRVLRC